MSDDGSLRRSYISLRHENALKLERLRATLKERRNLFEATIPMPVVGDRTARMSPRYTTEELKVVQDWRMENWGTRGIGLVTDFKAGEDGAIQVAIMTTNPTPALIFESLVAAGFTVNAFVGDERHRWYEKVTTTGATRSRRRVTSSHHRMGMGINRSILASPLSRSEVVALGIRQRLDWRDEELIEEAIYEREQ